MNPQDFLRTLYLGDRACKAVVLNGWDSRVEVHADCISRVRDPSGHWNYYTEEDIVDGRIVFTQVQSATLEPPGLLPNDSIESLVADATDENGVTTFTLTTNCVSESGAASLVVLTIKAKDVHIEDPKRAGMIIRD